jgi:hypothetical protein
MWRLDGTSRRTEKRSRYENMNHLASHLVITQTIPDGWKSPPVTATTLSTSLTELVTFPRLSKVARWLNVRPVAVWLFAREKLGLDGKSGLFC